MKVDEHGNIIDEEVKFSILPTCQRGDLTLYDFATMYTSLKYNDKLFIISLMSSGLTHSTKAAKKILDDVQRDILSGRDGHTWYYRKPLNY